MPSRSTSINALMNDITLGRLVLPDLQRDFVWKEDQIRLLLDSILRGYPFGSLLIWNTQFLQVPYVEFVRDFRTGQTRATRMKPVGKQRHMVLDGQQRLQSLYLAIFGTHDGRRLYFNVTSGPESGTGAADDDDGDAVGTKRNYRFEFWRDDEANRPKRLIRVADVVAWPSRYAEQRMREAITAVPLESAEADLACCNLRLLRQVLSDGNLVAVETIDDEAINAEQARSIHEILEIFVRVNSGGTRLSRSDLMFSLIKSREVGARHAFDTLVGAIDPGGILGIDKDFVIKGLLTVAGKPPTFEVENVERHWDEMSAKFETFSAALRSAVDFCRDADVGIRSAKFLSPINTLLPIVYYLSNRPRGSVPDGQRGNLRALLYFLLFNGFVNSDARIRYLREVFQRQPGETVPLDALLLVVAYRQKHHATTTSAAMVARNIALGLNIVQPDAARETLSWQSEPQIDHLFPQSDYRQKHGDLVDDIGNLAYLGRLRNIRKNDQPPWEYFRDVADAQLRDQFLIPDRSLLAAERFVTFVEQRRNLIVAKVRDFLGR
jgi:hypothetical protein